ncbi:unnamed protein product [Wuchereria bancrofti]|uniref:Uncharacterized protein n=1 Tax=Wuchereria bancrofti TaxID=6293 RepID=A0A3P7DYX3_WUCBA|nr:unnamed protein product [Wuchereria bancrofti]
MAFTIIGNVKPVKDHLERLLNEDIPGNELFNFLLLKRAALQSVRDFDVTPENYEIVRQISTEKYGNSSTIIKLLYNELHIENTIESRLPHRQSVSSKNGRQSMVNKEIKEIPPKLDQREQTMKPNKEDRAYFVVKTTGTMNVKHICQWIRD